MMSIFLKQQPGPAGMAVSRSRRGFTVIELMLALVVLAIIVALGAPGLMGFVVQSRMTSQINELLADVSYARSEAATRGVRVAICASNNATSASAICSTSVADWANGHIVFVDVDGSGQRDTGASSAEMLLKVAPGLTGGSTLTVTVNTGGTSGSGPAMIQFRPYGGMATNGSLNGLGGSTTLLSSAVFTLCPSTAGAQGRVMAIAMTGRPAISKQGC
ncbi:MAG TPA: GspH/FimT family pseudopilin [Burkholderiales bacterium]